MIFVTVGNAKQPFFRLLNEIESLANNGFFGNEEVFVQYGHNKPVKAPACHCQPFISMEEFNNKICKSRIVISHAGAGSLINIIESGQVPIIVPRQKKYGEHIDDHQIELAQVLSSEEKIIALHDIVDLPEALRKASRKKLKNKAKGNKKILDVVNNAILELI